MKIGDGGTSDRGDGGTSDRVTMFATGKVTNERWTCAGDGFVLLTTTNLSATLREPSLPAER